MNNQNQKGIASFLAIIIVIVVGVFAIGGVLVYQYWWPFEAPKIEAPKGETAAKEVVKGFLKTQQNRNFENAKPFLSPEFAQTIDPIGFSGTSNPHTGRFEIQDIQLLSDRKTYKVDVRVYQEYTGEGDIGYNDNNYYIKLFGDRYLIDNIEYGEYVELPKNETADWETYRNEEYGFEIKYPNNINTKQPVPDVFIANTEGSEYLQIQYLNTTPPKNYKPNNADFIGIVNIGGKEADKYYTNKPMGEGVIENIPYTCYVIILGEKEWIQIEYYGEKEIANLFNQMLSTFRFID